ncbi:MAG: ABC-2 family transporter protein [Bdellovibrionota bacterium]
MKKKRAHMSWRVAALKNGFRDATAYRWEFLIEVLGSAFVPAAIQAVLWYALFKVGGATEVAGMNYQELVQYTLVSLLFTQIRGGNQDFELQEMIRNGSLSNYLLRPVSVIEFVYFRGIAPKLLISGICLVFGLAVGAVVGLSAPHMIAAMSMALLGNLIHYQLGAALATTAFLWEEAYSVLMVKNILVSLLSGELLPLTFFPESWSWAWKSMPFYLYVFGPVEVALGRWGVNEYLYHMGFGFLWLILGWAAIRLTWGLGIRRYLSLGG